MHKKFMVNKSTFQTPSAIAHAAAGPPMHAYVRQASEARQNRAQTQQAQATAAIVLFPSAQAGILWNSRKK